MTNPSPVSIELRAGDVVRGDLIRKWRLPFAGRFRANLSGTDWSLPSLDSVRIEGREVVNRRTDCLRNDLHVKWN